MAELSSAATLTPTAQQTVGMAIPLAGDYVVTGSVVGSETSATNSASLTCDIRTDGTPAHYSAGFTQTLATSTLGSVTVQTAVRNVQAGTNVGLYCAQGGAGGVSVSVGVLTAIRVGELAYLP